MKSIQSQASYFIFLSNNIKWHWIIFVPPLSFPDILNENEDNVSLSTQENQGMHIYIGDIGHHRILVMACCLCGTKPLSEPIMTYCQIGKDMEISFEKLHLKMLSAKWQPFCSGLSMIFAQCYWVIPGTRHTKNTWAHYPSRVKILFATGMIFIPII